MDKNRIKIVCKGDNPETREGRVNTHGMWLGGFNAGTHSLVDIAEARAERDFKYVRKR